MEISRMRARRRNEKTIKLVPSTTRKKKTQEKLYKKLTKVIWSSKIFFLVILVSKVSSFTWTKSIHDCLKSLMRTT